MVFFGNVYRGRRVLVTGHTGFKGSWLCLWLKELGAEVAGYSIGLPTTPCNFELLDLSNHIKSYEGDIRNYQRLAEVVDEFQPEIVFHLAAQSLVRNSYVDPVYTFETNIMGMVNIAEIIRAKPSIEVAVLITSDKAYKNLEWCWGYRENDQLGGNDPYSASKSCADLIAQSYYKSFFEMGKTRVAIARAGNVIGGGDWAADRIVPDCIRAWSNNKSVTVRYPNATRPWQHVLEPLGGYLKLGSVLCKDSHKIDGEAYNFGPNANVSQTVIDLLKEMKLRWANITWNLIDDRSEKKNHEAVLLKLSCDKALHDLNWEPVLTFKDTVEMTIDWYRSWHEGNESLLDLSVEQIHSYSNKALMKSWINN